MYVTLLYPPCDKVNAAYIRQKTPKIRGFQSAKCLEDFPLPEHQNIRKAVLCVLPKEFCVRRSEKDPMILRIVLYEVVAYDVYLHRRRPTRLWLMNNYFLKHAAHTIHGSFEVLALKYFNDE